MTLSLNQALKKQGCLDKIGYEVQVNYIPIKPEQFESLNVENGDVVRLAKPYEMPIQFIVGEDEGGI